MRDRLHHQSHADMSARADMTQAFERQSKRVIESRRREHIKREQRHELIITFFTALLVLLNLGLWGYITVQLAQVITEALR